MSVDIGVQTADEDRHLIDLNISRHERDIQELKTRRNAFAAISCLLPEILSKIFLLVRDDATEWKPLEWIEVSYVCRHWRNVALTCPSLWTCLPRPLRSARWMEEILKRSKKASLIIWTDSLNLFVSCDEYPWRRMRSEYPEQARRIRDGRTGYVYGLGWRFKEIELVERYLPGVPKNSISDYMLSFLEPRWTAQNMKRFGCVFTLSL